MFTGSSALVAVRRRDPIGRSNLPATTVGTPGSDSLVLQMLLAKMDSLDQRINALTVRRPGPLQQVEPINDEDDMEPARTIEPGTLTQIFD